MAKRLQVILRDPEYREIQRLARSRRMSLAEWVRQALDVARRREPMGNAGKKLQVIRAAARHDFPTGDIDAEVLQEILHRCAAINRRDAIQAAFDALLGIVDQVFSVDAAAAVRAKEILLGYRHVSARDALHLAVMEQQKVERILSFDAGFDDLPGISRLH